MYNEKTDFSPETLITSPSRTCEQRKNTKNLDSRNSVHFCTATKKPLSHVTGADRIKTTQHSMVMRKEKEGRGRKRSAEQKIPDPLESKRNDTKRKEGEGALA
jgi:hypothetical protein